MGRKEDKFIKQKLDYLTNTDDIDIVFPDRKEKNREIAKNLVVPQKEAKKKAEIKIKHKRALYVSLSSLAAVVIILAIMLPILLLNGPSGGDELYFNDDDLYSQQVEISIIESQYDVILPDYNNYEHINVLVFKDKLSDKSVYIKIMFTGLIDSLEYNIVLVDNYNIITSTLYENLTNAIQYNSIDFHYYVNNDNEVAYAKFLNAKNRYFCCYNSFEPENILSILSSIR